MIDSIREYELYILNLGVGRAVLQKRIMALLRKIDQPTPGNTQAWEETFRHWDQGTRTFVNYPKSKADEGTVSRGYLHSITLFPMLV